MFPAKIAVVVMLLKPATDKPFRAAVGIGEALKNEVIAVGESPSPVLSCLVRKMAVVIRAIDENHIGFLFGSLTVEELVIKPIGGTFVEPAIPDGLIAAIFFKGLATTDSDKQLHVRQSSFLDSLNSLVRSRAK